MTTDFRIVASDNTTDARVGQLQTRRGPIETPVFMPVGTQAAVKTVTPDEVRASGSPIILANTYHLLLRPGVEILQEAGGVHSFMNWNGPILTDSGGFQIFSLANRRKVSEQGVEFRSHIDGRKIELTPESVVDLQIAYGSDIMMPLDELAGYDASPDEQRSAAERTIRWLERSVDYYDSLRERGSDAGLLFGIAQGGFDANSRTRGAQRTAELPVDGYSIGGLSVGEPKTEMLTMLEASIAGLPSDKPRYLMGVGSPEDLWEAVSRGVDMFDCVHPTRVARRGAFFTRDGRVNITTARYQRQLDPIDPDCDCSTCTTFSAAYLHHLFRAGEMLGPRLATIHNLRFFNRITEEMRAAIQAGDFEQQRNAFLDRYVPVDERVVREQRYRWETQQSLRHEVHRKNRQ